MKFNLSKLLQCRLNVFIFNAIGWTATFLFVSFLGKLYFLLNRNEKETIVEALHKVFAAGQKAKDVSLLIPKVFAGIICHYYEKIFNAYSNVDTLNTFLRRHVICEGLEALRHIRAKGNGALLITGHLGGVEYIPAYLGINHFDPSIIVRFSSKQLRQRSLEKAAKFSAKIIDVDETPNVMKAILNDLNENRTVIIQCDEIDEWRPSNQNEISFLGKQIRLDKTLNILIKRARVPVVLGIMQRSGPQQYKFIVRAYEAVAKQFPKIVAANQAAVILKFIESYIYAFPADWYQWKKYFSIQTAPVPVFQEPETSFISLTDSYLKNAA